VELFEQIRREYRFGVGTIQGVAKKLGCIGAWCVRRDFATLNWPHFGRLNWPHLQR
jgi:hypothetical protein